MNIFHKVTLQSMKKSRTRTIVTVIGVILSAAMITAVTTFSVSLLNYMIKGATVKYGGWHVEFLDVDSSFAEERARDDGVAGAAISQNIGYAELKGGKNPNKPYLFIAGFSKEAFDTVPIELVSGRLPENSGEILVPAHVAANGGVTYAVGDTLSLAVGSRMDGEWSLGQHDPFRIRNEPGKGTEIFVPQEERTYTVVGICERPAFEEFTAPGYTLITTEDTAADTAAGLTTGPSDQRAGLSVFVTLKNPRKVQAYIGRTAGQRAYILNDNVLRFLGVSSDHLFNVLLYSVGGILMALIMTGSIFLIYNSFTISLNERTRQFGILASVGATAGQLRNSVLFEGLCIGAAGIPIGIIVGLGSIGLVISFVAEKFKNFGYSAVSLSLTVSGPAIAGAAVVSLVTILFAAYIPARKAAARPVMESIRQTNEIKIESGAVRTSKLAKRIYGLEGMLALKNFKRNKKRCRSIVLSLSLSVVLFVSANAFGSCLNQGAKRSVVNTDFDICFSSAEIDENELFQLYGRLKTAEGIKESSYQALMSYSCAVRAGDLSDEYRKHMGYENPDETVTLPMDIQFIEDREFRNFIESQGLSPEEYTGQNAKMIAVAKQKSDKTKRGQRGLVNMFVGDSVSGWVTPGAGQSGEMKDNPQADMEKQISITFVDTIPLDTLPKNSSDAKPFLFMIVAPWQLREQFASPDAGEVMGLTFLSDKPSQAAEEMAEMIQKAGIGTDYTLYNVNRMFEENRSILFVINVFTYVFVMMISLIAAANVFNTISTNIKLRRRELAMLRSVGMSDRDFNKMMNFECAFYGMRTLLFGLPAAGICSCLIYCGMVAGGADVSFVFPWASMAVSAFGVFFIVFITMMFAVRKLKKENIIDALRDDMS
ncbi:ABC transporter permease [Hungatella hathewayi]|uniref:ABC transporter permease n=1 Tax=Hungatella hathewayi TaxID=154046 RepID=UPI003565DB7F